MKKLLVLLLLVSIKHSNAQTSKIKQTTVDKHQTSNARYAANSYKQAQSTVSLLDSTKYWTWDTISFSWKISNKTINYMYDGQYRNTSNLTKHWNGTAWVDKLLVTNTYNNNIENQLQQNWNAGNSVWVNNQQFTSTYDASNNLLNSVEQLWSTNAWVNRFNEIYTYNAGNKNTSYVEQVWSNNTWYNDSRNIMHYNANNIETDYSISLWNLNTHAMTDSAMVTNTINGSNNINSAIDFDWNTVTNVFDTVGLDSYTYDAHHNMLSSLEQTSNGFSWVNSTKGTFTYDANNNQTSDIGYYWVNNAWLNDTRIFNTYDGYSNNLSNANKRWTGHTWIGDSTHYYYTTITSIEQIDNKHQQVKIYPNPANNILHIEMEMLNEKTELKLFDINGRLLLNQFIQDKTTVDVSGLNAGVYSLNITNNEGALTKKLVIVK
ncbi:MAG TPA: T9SS type A sorting domain-containing protein [Bacteroidia bacterium]|jgi:hypothetical protein|nr:T9SS type A sorting domain-containing protein [Bacteroidia bacterium]